MDNKNLLNEFLGNTQNDWEKEAESSLNGKPVSKLISKTYEDIEIQPIYFHDCLKDIDFLLNEYPGFYPFLRNNKILGYKLEKWRIAQELLTSNPIEYNKAIKENIKREQDCLIIENDIYSQNSLINNINDFEVLFQDLELSHKYIILRLGKYPYSLLSMYLAYLQKFNYDLLSINGSIEYDFLDILIENGFIPYSIDFAFEQLSNIIRFSIDSLPLYKTITITSKALSYGGANVVLELAYILTKGIYYINKLISSGFSIDEIIPRIKFNIFSSPYFFTDIAKIRALRLLWSEIVKVYSPTNNNHTPIIHFTTNNYNKTKLDIENNILRNTTETLSAIISGCDIITTHSFGYPYFENDLSRRIAINTQLILKYECNLTEVIDPAGGAYFVESLTDQLIKKIWNLVQHIESMGGIFEVINNGWLQEQVENTAKKRVNNLNNRKDILVGVNKYPKPNENYNNLRQMKIPNDAKNINLKCQDFVETTILEKKCFPINIPIINELLKKGYSIHDLNNILYKDKYSKYETKPIPILNLSSKFEELRLKSEQYKEKTGIYPQCFLANLGTVSQFKARTDFANDFLRVAGIETIYTDGFENIVDCVKAFFNSNTNLLVICSTDEIYYEKATQLARLIKKAKPLTYIILAGNPGEKINEYQSSGIDDFIHIKSNIYDSLTNILNIITKY